MNLSTAMNSDKPHPPLLRQNDLLSALPEAERQQLLSQCKLVSMSFMQVLAEPGDKISQIYFPIDSYISLISPVDDNANIEVGFIGCEGMLGIWLTLGIEAAPQRALVQGPGMAYCMDSQVFMRVYEQSSALQRLLKRYLYVLMGQLAQTAACTRFHVVQGRLARWLLMTRDRAQSDEFYITHELLAYILGVRRVGITRAASALQALKLISYRRGEIKILDHAGLEAASCSCYAADREAYEEIMHREDL